MPRGQPGSAITQKCTECDAFFYVRSNSKPRYTCSIEHSKQRLRRLGLWTDKNVKGTCRICSNSAATPKSSYCSSCKPAPTLRHNVHNFVASGYVGETGPEARLSPAAINGWTLVHRKVAYVKYGPGPHECHWGCGRILDWNIGDPKMTGKIVIDHIDDDPENNSPENLVVSCNGCNTNRSRGRGRGTY